MDEILLLIQAPDATVYVNVTSLAKVHLTYDFGSHNSTLWKFPLSLCRFHQRYCPKSLHMPWQLCCHGMCKILGQSDSYWLWDEFPQNIISTWFEWEIISETFPWSVCLVCVIFFLNRCVICACRFITWWLIRWPHLVIYKTKPLISEAAQNIWGAFRTSTVKYANRCRGAFIILPGCRHMTGGW